MTWQLHPDGAVSSDGEPAHALYGDDLALATQFLTAREVADEAEHDRINLQSILCAHIEGEKHAFVPERGAVLTFVQTENRLVDWDAVRVHLKTAELTLDQWKTLAMAATTFSRSRLNLKKDAPLRAILDQYTTNGWREPYLKVTYVKEEA